MDNGSITVLQAIAMAKVPTRRPISTRQTDPQDAGGQSGDSAATEGHAVLEVFLTFGLQAKTSFSSQQRRQECDPAQHGAIIQRRPEWAFTGSGRSRTQAVNPGRQREQKF